MTFKTRLSVLLLSTPLLVFVIVGGLMGKASAGSGDETFQHLRVFEDVVSLVMSNYVEEVRVDKAMEGALRGLAEGLDPDSAYLSAAQVRDLESGKGLPEGGIGVELTRQFYLRVIAAREGSAAAKAGLRTGDYIRSIDGQATRDMSVYEGVRLLRGQPGSQVKLTVLRGNAAEPHEVTITREKATVPPVTSKTLGSVGYIRIPAFGPSTAPDVRRHATELTKGGARALVIDLRHTAEGAIEHGVATARLFVKSGTLAIKAGRETAAGGKGAAAAESRETIAAAPGDGAIDAPVTLLVTAGTSGAAEVFAAALEGNNRAELVGEHTIGRAALQKLVKLPEGRGLWLTHVRFLRPSGDPLHGPGLEPAVEVAQPDVEFGAPPPANDPILDAALERLKTK